MPHSMPIWSARMLEVRCVDRSMLRMATVHHYHTCTSPSRHPSSISRAPSFCVFATRARKAAESRSTRKVRESTGSTALTLKCMAVNRGTARQIKCLVGCRRQSYLQRCGLHHSVESSSQHEWPNLICSSCTQHWLACLRKYQMHMHCWWDRGIDIHHRHRLTRDNHSYACRMWVFEHPPSEVGPPQRFVCTCAP